MNRTKIKEIGKKLKYYWCYGAIFLLMLIGTCAMSVLSEKAEAMEAVKEERPVHKTVISTEVEQLQASDDSAIAEEEIFGDVRKYYSVTEDESISELSDNSSAFQEKDTLALGEETSEISSDTSTEEADSIDLSEDTATEVVNPIAGEKFTIEFNVLTPCEFTKDEFITIISNLPYDENNVMEETAEFVWDECAQYGINPIFIEGIIATESLWGRSSYEAEEHNNLTGFTTDGNGNVLEQFSSKEDCIKHTINHIYTSYLREDGKNYGGGTLIKNVNLRYNPKHEESCTYLTLSSPTWEDCDCNFDYAWGELVSECMNMIVSSESQ